MICGTAQTPDFSSSWNAADVCFVDGFIKTIQMVKSSEIVDHGFFVSPTDVFFVTEMIILDGDARTGDNIGAKYIVKVDSK